MRSRGATVRRLLIGAAALAGLFGGPSVLEAAAASQPPMDGGGLAFAGLGALVGLPLVLGFQALLGNFKTLRLGWWLFLFAAAYCTTAGLAALVLAARSGAVLVPSAWLFLVVGLAMLAGLAFVRVAFRRRFAGP